MLISHSYFPTDVYRNELPGWVAPTERASSKYFADASDNVSVFQTANMVGDKELFFIEEYFLKESVYILDKQGYDLEGYNFYVREMWGQLFNYGGFNWPHVHPGSLISGLYFFDVPGHTNAYSDVALQDSRISKSMTELRLKNSPNIEYATPLININKVLKGTFLFFNSWLTHHLTPNLSNTSLKFLHFNLYYENKRL